VLAITLADLRFRARQFLIAIVGAALALSLALVLSGLQNGFHAEIADTVNAVNADSWVMANGASGRLTAFAPFSETAAATLRAQPGVRAVGPILLLPASIVVFQGKDTTSNLMGVVPGRLGSPVPVAGHALSGPNQVVADSKLNLPIGSRITVSKRPFTVVGTVDDRTLLAGTPMIYMSLRDSQLIAVGGLPLVTAIALTGHASSLPHGLSQYSPEQVISQTEAQMSSAAQSIGSVGLLMWVVAAVIIAALLYVAALERARDFAVLKAIGTSTVSLSASVALEAVFVTLVAAFAAEILAQLLAPTFSQRVAIPVVAYFTLPLIAVIVGLIASLVAVRGVIRADPASAFG